MGRISKMKADKSHRMFFAVLFGVMGITLLVLAWLRPVSIPDRIIAAAVGSVGLFVAVVRLPALRRLTKAESKRRPVNTEVKDKS